MIGKKSAPIYILHNGFSLIEMLCCLALIAIIINMSVVWSSTHLERVQLNQASKEIQAHFTVGHLLGLMSANNLILCPNDHEHCGTNWSLPWMLVQKQNQLRVYQFSEFPAHVKIERVAWQKGPLEFPKRVEATGLSGHFLVSTAHWQTWLTVTREGCLHEHQQNPPSLLKVQENRD